uniref:Putative secreted protein n=1 Tax=Anopheles darlingi TaxID=43151 RepID=A0A2M4DFI0_ANODA
MGLVVAAGARAVVAIAAAVAVADGGDGCNALGSVEICEMIGKAKALPVPSTSSEERSMSSPATRESVGQASWNAWCFIAIKYCSSISSCNG